MRTILIDPTVTTPITEHIITPTADKPILQTLYATIGCNLIEFFNPRDALWKYHSIIVDEEGMLKDLTYGFEVTGGWQPYYGRGLVVGPTDNMGEMTDCALDLETVRDNVTLWSFYNG